jgi:hypothetical protein
MRYRIDVQGEVTPSNPNPHVMFYGPGLSDADIGGVRGSLLFMNKVGPDGMIIVPVGSKEREAILGESRPLIERVENALGYKASGEGVGRALSHPAHCFRSSPRRGRRRPSRSPPSCPLERSNAAGIV